MAQFKAFVEGVEVNGETVLSVVNGLGAYEDVGRKILAAHGIDDPQPGRWYPQQAWLDAFRAIAGRLGPGALRSIGKAIPASAQWPPEVDSIEKALQSIDVAYHINHRGGEIGYYHYEPVNFRSGKMVCRNPYPSEFDQGIVEAVVRRFAPEGAFPVVRLDEQAPTRKNGADACTYWVSW
jgi:hypothetical protein